ncbi:MAG: DUF302 domain-containing protein [Rhodobacteraceae bacterium]|nr:DUF302 domain-containing protein [Paracoccaceae bacterium]
MRQVIKLLSLFALSAAPALAADLQPRDGWVVQDSAKSHAQLATDLRKAVKDNGLIVVTQAGPTKAAARRGITIPGNLVVGVFNNDYAVRVLELSTAAMIEAPIRFYVTEDADGSATLSYKTPSHVFAPYVTGADTALSDIARELDDRFARISQDALK